MSKVWTQKLLLLIQLMFLLQHGVDSGSVVTHLPGFEGPLPFHLETGYIGVGEEENVQLFYYFVKSENNPKQDPLLIWLTGGPACSALSALVFQNGPLAFKIEVYNGTLPSLVSTSYSWTKEASIIFLDQPVGTGFSYSKNPLADIPSDTGEAKQTYEFLQKWFVEHPEFASNPLYVAGDSYSGMVVPAIVQEISSGNEDGDKTLINLKGYVLGNPLTDMDYDANHKIPYTHRMGLISDELYESLERSCKGNYFNIDSTNTLCLKLMDDYNKCVSRIFQLHILEPLCEETSSTSDCHVSKNKINHSSYKLLLAKYWANDEDVRKALHVVNGSIGKWARCDFDMAYTMDIKSSIPYHQNHSSKGIYRSLIYSGDHDMLVSFLGTQAWIKSLNYPVIDEWRPWFGNDQVLGYTRSYANNMTFATIKGGGHVISPNVDEGFMMFKRWIRGQCL